MNDELDEQLTSLASSLIRKNEAHEQKVREEFERVQSEKELIADRQTRWATQFVPELKRVAEDVKARLHGAVFVRVQENTHGPVTASVTFTRKNQGLISYDQKYSLDENGSVSVETRRGKGAGHIPLHHDTLFPVTAIEPKGIKRAMIRAVSLLNDEPA